jgi:glyoxylase-like metal-dependent hydrolase (beta-lactamase superfamily II)
MKRVLLLGLAWVVTLPSSAKDHPALSMNVFTSPDDQFWVNSTIIEGAREVMLVDAQLTRTSAEKVLQQIQDTKKPLSLIYLTHEHTDHFLANQPSLPGENREMEKDFGIGRDVPCRCDQQVRR